MTTELRPLSSIELRYVLTLYLFDYGPATVAELARGVAAQGFATRGRASKAISDALRWECGYDRVRRLRRGWYGPGSMPRSTEHRIHTRVWALRAEVGSRAPGPPRRDRATVDAVPGRRPPPWEFGPDSDRDFGSDLDREFGPD